MCIECQRDVERHGGARERETSDESIDLELDVS